MRLFRQSTRATHHTLLYDGGGLPGSWRIWVGFLAALSLTLGLLVSVTSPSWADTQVSSATVELDTFPSVQTAQLDQFDDMDGTLVLDQVTITATVDAAVEGTLENLSDSVDKTLEASVEAGIDVNGPAVTDLSADATSADSFTLAPGEETPFALNDSGEAVATITDPDELLAFIGDGTLDYEVAGQVRTTVSGPAPYLSTGETNGSATVEIEYEFTDISEPAIDVVKTNDADEDGTFTDSETAPEEGAAVDFHVEITNTGNTPLTLTSLIDAFGDTEVDTIGADFCDLVGTVLAIGDSVECTFTLEDYAPAPGDELTNTVTVTGTDGDTIVTDDDPSTVDVTADPAIEVVKDNDADKDGSFSDSETASAEGNAVDFQLVITNTGNVDLTLTSLVDDFDGTTVNLFDGDNGTCDELEGTTLAVSASTTCTFTLADYAPAAGTSLENIVTVAGEDDFGTEVTDNDPSTVDVGANPAIEVVKTNDADDDGTFTDSETAPEEGAAVPFELEITNTGDVDLTLTSLVDDFDGTTVNLFDGDNGTCDELEGTTLAVSASTTCTFTLADYAPAAGTSLENIVTVAGEDDFGTEVTDNDPSTVTTPLPPCVIDEEDLTNDAPIKFDADKFGSVPEGEAEPFSKTGPGDVTVTITVTGDEEGQWESVSWTSTDPIEWVVVKTGADGGGLGTTFHVDGATSGGPYGEDELGAPNAISHISFFYCIDGEPAPGAEE